jgi:hypothetical protein
MPLSEDLTNQQALRSAVDYLCSFPVRNPDGSVNRSYDLRSKSCSYVYHEITGYAISVFVNCYAWWHEERYNRLAQESVAYFQNLYSRRRSKAAFPHGKLINNQDFSDTYYSFDNAMILQGLCMYFHLRPSKELTDIITGMSNWLVSEMQQNDGSFHAFIDRKGAFKHRGKLFFYDQGCLHAKHAISMIRAFKITRDEANVRACKKLCDWALSCQREDGLFWANTYKEHVYSHAHCYALEGLLFAYHFFKEESYLTAVEKGANALRKIQQRSGAIPEIPFDRRINLQRIKNILGRSTTDCTAQAIRIWISLDVLSGRTDFSVCIENAVSWLLSMQIDKNIDLSGAGALYYDTVQWGFYSSRGKLLPTWCTQFFLHALICAQRYRSGELTFTALMDEWF